MIARSDSAPVPDGALLSGESGLPFAEVEQRVLLLYRGASVRHRLLAFYLHDIEQRGLYKLASCRTVPQYAAMRIGMTVREARELLRVGRALAELTEIDRAFAEGEITYSKVRLLARVATPRHEQRWLQTAKELSIEKLALEVRLSRPGDAPRDRSSRKGLPEIRLTYSAELPIDVHAKVERAVQKVRDAADREVQPWEFLDAAADAILAMDGAGDAPGEGTGRDKPGSDRTKYMVVVNTARDGGTAEVDTDDGPMPLDGVTAKALCCDGHCLDDSRNGAEADRNVPMRLRRAVFARDDRRCRCCGTRYSLQIHHVIPVSEGGPTVIGNLVTTCRHCHAMIHAELITIEGRSPETWRFANRDGEDLHGEVSRKLTFAEGRESFRIPPPKAPQCGAPAVVRPSWHRPCRFSDVVGQSTVIESLAEEVAVALDLEEPLPHVLLEGPSGLGKTTLARAIACEMGVSLTETDGSMVREPAEMVRMVANADDRSVVFVDEAHAMPQPVAEAVYRAMDDATSGRFTLVAATTEAGTLPGAFLNRFPIHERLEFYDTDSIAEIIRRAVERLGAASGRGQGQGQAISIDPEAARRLASVAQDTPRRALHLLRRVRTLVLRRDADAERIMPAHVETLLVRQRIDRRGLDPDQRRYLELLRRRGPLGVQGIATTLSIDIATIKHRVEPYLFRIGLATTTPRGRLAIA